MGLQPALPEPERQKFTPFMRSAKCGSARLGPNVKHSRGRLPLPRAGEPPLSTKFSAALLASNTDGTVFRAWRQFVHAAFRFGFGPAADTGQVDLVTVT